MQKIQQEWREKIGDGGTGTEKISVIINTYKGNNTARKKTQKMRMSSLFFFHYPFFGNLTSGPITA